MTAVSADGNITLSILHELGRAVVAGAYDNRPFPIEARLCDKLNVSRSVLREAVKMLTAKGLLASRPRHGTWVEPEANWNFLDPDVLRWLLERGLSLDLLAEFTDFRKAIEPQAVALAIENAGDAELQAIKDALKKMTAAADGDGDPLQSDIDFHVSILHASANRFMIQCKDLVETALRSSIQLTNRLKGVQTADIEAHAAIAEGIFKGDVAKAQHAVHALLNEASALIERARQEGI